MRLFETLHARLRQETLESTGNTNNESTNPDHFRDRSPEYSVVAEPSAQSSDPVVFLHFPDSDSVESGAANPTHEHLHHAPEAGELSRALDALLVLEAAAAYCVQHEPETRALLGAPEKQLARSTSGPPPTSQIGSIILDTGLSAALVRAILQRFEAGGLVQRSSRSRRYRDVRLTPRGWTALADVGIDAATLDAANLGGAAFYSGVTGRDFGSVS